MSISSLPEASLLNHYATRQDHESISYSLLQSQHSLYTSNGFLENNRVNIDLDIVSPVFTPNLSKNLNDNILVAEKRKRK